MKKYILLLAVSGLIPSASMAATVNEANMTTFQSGTAAVAAEVNGNFTEVKNAIAASDTEITGNAAAIASNNSAIAANAAAISSSNSSLDARLSALEAELANRQLTGADKYAGTYTVTSMESQYYGCQPAGTDIASVLTDGNPTTNFNYFVNQQLSDTSTRTTTYDATSVAGVLTIPPYTLLTHDIDLGGIASVDTRTEGDFDLDINPDGSILFTPEPTVVLTGQFSADGSTFTFLVEGQFIDGGCNDNFMIIAVGVRK